MKLILKENIETLGQIGDIVKVAPGYARNYLLPKGLAIEATAKNAKALESSRNLAEKLSAVNVTLSHKAGEEGKLFGSVTTMEIAEFLKAQGFDIDRKKIVLPEAIKQVGEYTLTVKIHPEVSASIKVTVTAA